MGTMVGTMERRGDCDEYPIHTASGIGPVLVHFHFGQWYIGALDVASARHELYRYLYLHVLKIVSEGTLYK